MGSKTVDQLGLGARGSKSTLLALVPELLKAPAGVDSLVCRLDALRRFSHTSHMETALSWSCRGHALQVAESSKR